MQLRQLLPLLLAHALLGAVGLAMAKSPKASPTLELIQNRGSTHVGVKSDSPLWAAQRAGSA
jgi:hypothetical protein